MSKSQQKSKSISKTKPKKKDDTKVEKNDTRVLVVQTTQTAAFKQVVERIQNVISDCCLVFVPPDDDNDENITDDYYESDAESDTDIKETPKKSNRSNKSNKSNTSKKKRGKGSSAESESEEPDIKSSRKKNTSSKKKSRKIESDEESDEIPKKKITSNKKNTSSKKKSRKIESDEEESESDEPPKKKNTSTKKKSKPIESESSEENIKTTRRTKTKPPASTRNKKPIPKPNPNPNPKIPTKKKNSGGIRILRLTQDKSVLVKLILAAANFDTFYCAEPKITIGIDMSQLHNMLKSFSDNDPITLYMNRNNRSTLYIHSNSENKEETDLEIYLMDIPNLDIPLPRRKFQNKITIASDKFHSICKQLNNTSVHVEITSVDNEIQFNGKNEGGKIVRTYRDDNLKKKKGENPVFQGVYELRNLMYFSKCNKLCQTIDIYLKDDFPLVLVISIATLGKMYIFLTPIDPNGNI